MLNESISFAESIDRLKESFLCAAAQGGNYQDCESLLEIGADINWKNTDGDTPLLAACRRGHTETIELLLSHGADSNIAGNDGYAPLHVCARRGDANSVDVLLNANTNTALKTSKGQTALDIAKEKGHEAVYSRIFRHRPGLNRITPALIRVIPATVAPVGNVRGELPAVTPPVGRSGSDSRRGNRSNLNDAQRSQSLSMDTKDSDSGSVDRLINSLGNSLITSRSDKSSTSTNTPSSSSIPTTSTTQNLRPLEPSKNTTREEAASKASSHSYAIVGQPGSGAGTGMEDTSAVIGLKRLLDAEKVAKNILEAKLEVFASQNKQLVEEFRVLSAELTSSQEAVETLQKKVNIYEGKSMAVNQLSIDDCEEYEKLLKKTLVILEERKAHLTKNLIESQKEQRLCVICQEHEKTVVLLPCRHLCLCDTCSSYDQLEHCPLCRKPVAHKISVFN